MNFDFAAFLVIAVIVTGAIWAVDSLAFAPRRRLASGDDEGQESGSEIAVSALSAPKEPILVEYARSFFPVILIVLLLRSFLVEPFKIPSGSMMPTLVAGDFILVNKFSYGIRLPVLNAKIIEIGSPQRGDVVVFRYPINPKVDYIKRIVGLPGDRISYQNKRLFVNGEEVTQTPMGYYQGVGSGSNMNGASVRIENLPGKEHQILIRQNQPNHQYPCLAMGEYIIPAGHYFAMGDNRDNSNDSRFWCAVPDENLVGKAFFIWMNWEVGEAAIGWNRIGSSIN